LSNGELPPAVRVNDLSITYRTTLEREPTLKQALIRFGRGQRTVKEIEAIKDVTSQVRTGTAMGIIGSNGSVKSTLMRAMAGILPPTSGSIEVWGRASTLLALGSGSTTTFPGGRTSSWAGCWVAVLTRWGRLPAGRPGRRGTSGRVSNAWSGRSV
jgi:ABC-type polysaccharide/polyol phosphate transport system ATPase subunit